MSVHTQARVEERYEVVVVGGGIAGLCAAIGAARRGARTAIVQDRPVFGGNSSSEIRVAPLGAATFNQWARETGILEELLLEERARNHDDIYDGMANSHYDLVLYEAARREPNLTMFLNTSVRAVEAETLPNGERRIVAVYGSQLASEKEFVFKADHFADCTGDATLGALAGAEFRYGRESRQEFNEPLAPVKADTQTMGSTLTMRARNIGRPVKYTPPEWITVYKTPGEIGPARDPNRFNRIDYGGYWWIEIGSPFHQIDDNQKIKEELLKHVLGVWNYIKNYSADKEVAANYALEWIGMVPGKRESRRLIGDVILTEHDVHIDRQWPDRVCYAGWFIDLHIMGGILNKKEPGEMAHSDQHYANWVRVSPFSLPLRALYSRNVVNLWMAGRNISVTHVALGATRVMMTHALQGQAIGTAAAHAVKNNLTARQVADPAGPHLRVIQQRLLRDDVNAFGLRNEDTQDLARAARATATSEAKLDFGEPVMDAYADLGTNRWAMAFPLTADRLDTVELFLKNNNGGPVTVQAELQRIDGFWDRRPGERVARWTFEVPGGFQGWMKSSPGAAIAAPGSFRLCLSQTKGVYWYRSNRYIPGTVTNCLFVSPGGCEPKNLHMNTLQPHETALPAYETWRPDSWFTVQTLRLSPPSEPFNAGNVNNGLAWPFVMPNLWVSDPAKKLPQSVTLEFGASKSINTVQVSFDTDLRSVYHAMSAFWRASTCARDWRLYAKCGEMWRMVFEENGNYLRRRTARFPAVTASALKLEVLATNAPPENVDHQTARVYEIRIYDE